MPLCVRHACFMCMCVCVFVRERETREGVDRTNSNRPFPKYAAPPIVSKTQYGNPMYCPWRNTRVVYVCLAFLRFQNAKKAGRLLHSVYVRARENRATSRMCVAYYSRPPACVKTAPQYHAPRGAMWNFPEMSICNRSSLGTVFLLQAFLSG